MERASNPNCVVEDSVDISVTIYTIMGNEYGMPRGQITSLTKANKTSESLRTTVPSSVIKQFDLKEGDRLSWWLEPDKKVGILIRVEPIREESTGKDGVGVK